jgi:hypothetical protein
VLDETAFTLCKENNIPVLVFDLHETGNVLRAVQGMPSLGTVVDAAPDEPGDIAPCNEDAVARQAILTPHLQHPMDAGSADEGEREREVLEALF